MFERATGRGKDLAITSRWVLFEPRGQDFRKCNVASTVNRHSQQMAMSSRASARPGTDLRRGRLDSGGRDRRKRRAIFNAYSVTAWESDSTPVKFESFFIV
jgi:hypothetical protein